MVNVHIHQFAPGGAVVDANAMEQFQKQWGAYQKLVDFGRPLASGRRGDAASGPCRRIEALHVPRHRLRRRQPDQARPRRDQGQPLSRHRPVGAGDRAGGEDARRRALRGRSRPRGFRHRARRASRTGGHRLVRPLDPPSRHRRQAEADEGDPRRDRHRLHPLRAVAARRGGPRDLDPPLPRRAGAALDDAERRREGDRSSTTSRPATCRRPPPAGSTSDARPGSPRRRSSSSTRPTGSGSSATTCEAGSGAELGADDPPLPLDHHLPGAELLGADLGEVPGRGDADAVDLDHHVAAHQPGLVGKRPAGDGADDDALRRAPIGEFLRDRRATG